MDSRVTMALAGVLLLGAVAAGYWGLKLSGAPAPQQATQVVPEASLAPITSRLDKATDDAQRAPVVVAVRTLSPFVPVAAEDVQIEQLRIVPAGSFSSIEQVVGKMAWNPIAAGSWLNQESFAAGGPLAQMIRPDERALAVPVDEVIGGGGHLRPGDYVDVLLFMNDDGSNRHDGQAKTAQVAVPALRLLSIGEALGPTNTGQAAEVKDDDKDKNGKPKAARSVVLAVPEQWLTRLMLASQAGTLRLAVRSADEHLHKRYAAGEAILVQLDEKTRNLLPLQQLASQSAPRSVTTPQVRRAANTSRPRVEIYRGVDNSWQTP